jgi:large subunit ribosomal protein L31
MKKDIHPNYHPQATVTCACGNTWQTGSTKPEIRTDVCYQCHPFFTGEQRIVDTEGQVDRFYKKLQAREDYISEKEAAAAAQVSPDRPLSDLGLTKRVLGILENAEMTNVGHVLAGLEKGEAALLNLDGFGRKSLADLKKGLRKLGYEIPEAAEEIAV